MKRHIFISYSKSDRDFAWKLADDLSASGLRVWIDRSLQVGQDWETMIEQSLNDSNEVIVILSKQSVESKWVMHEGSMAYAMKKAIFPIVIDDFSKDNLPIWSEKTQFHSFADQDYNTNFKNLLAALTPPNPLQDVLDMQVGVYQDTGELLGAAMLEVLENDRDNLVIDAEAKALLEASAHAIKKGRNRNRILAGVLFSLVGAMVIAFVMMFLLFRVARGTIERERAERLAALSQLEIGNDQEIALLLAAQGYQTLQTPSGLDALRQVVGYYGGDAGLEGSALVDAACDLAGRNLTTAEWVQYLGDATYEPACPQWPSATNLEQ